MTTTTERTEAEIRRLMARHAAIEVRGWDSEAERALIRARIDELLDEGD